MARAVSAWVRVVTRPPAAEQFGGLVPAENHSEQQSQPGKKRDEDACDRARLSREGDGARVVPGPDEVAVDNGQFRELRAAAGSRQPPQGVIGLGPHEHARLLGRERIRPALCPGLMGAHRHGRELLIAGPGRHVDPARRIHVGSRYHESPGRQQRLGRVSRLETSEAHRRLGGGGGEFPGTGQDRNRNLE